MQRKGEGNEYLNSTIYPIEDQQQCKISVATKDFLLNLDDDIHEIFIHKFCISLETDANSQTFHVFVN